MNQKEGQSSMQKYEYKFVRLGERWICAKKKARNEYRSVIRQHPLDGWRLVQVFAPGLGAYGAAKCFERIFEREAQ